MTALGMVAPLGGDSRLTRVAARLLSLSTIGLLVGIVGWEFIARSAQATFLPPPSSVVGRIIDLATSGQLLPPLEDSLGSLAVGLLISLVIGISVGLLTGTSRRAALALDPYVNALLTAPSLVFAPVFFSIWGIGNESIIALIVTYAVFALIVNTAVAVRTVSGDLREMAVSFDASPRQIFLKVTLPAATPLILAGVRVAVARAVKGMINGEMFIAVVGLGQLIENAQHQLDATTVVAVLVVIIAVALALMWVVDRVDARLTGWLPTTARAG